MPPPPPLNTLLLSPGDNTYKVNAQQINQRAALLQKHLSDEQKELQALFALQALMVHMEQPASESHLGSGPGGPNVLLLTPVSCPPPHRPAPHVLRRLVR